MTKREGKAEVVDIKGLLERDEDFMRSAVEVLVQAALEAEMTEAIGAAKSERSETRIAYRSGYYPRCLITRVGTLELGCRRACPGDGRGPVGAVFDRAVRALSALGRRWSAPWPRMYVQGVSTRKVKAVTAALCGHSFSASSISSINKSLDEALKGLPSGG